MRRGKPEYGRLARASSGPVYELFWKVPGSPNAVPGSSPTKKRAKCPFESLLDPRSPVLVNQAATEVRLSERYLTTGWRFRKAALSGWAAGAARSRTRSVWPRNGSAVWLKRPRPPRTPFALRAAGGTSSSASPSGLGAGGGAEGRGPGPPATRP